MKTPAKGTVLVVDDNAQGRALAGDVLEHAGFQVFLAGSGKECLELSQRHRPDVVVLDRIMPGTSGDEVAEILKRDPALSDIKIIMLSAKDSADERVEGLSIGADDYLTKPYNRRELAARVAVHARTKMAEDELQRAYAEIERRVEERTGELSQANRQLNAEVAERKKAEQALREALAELEVLKNQLQAENIYLQDEIKTTHNFEEIKGGSEVLGKVLRGVEQVAPTDATVLVLGESGTGKELVARAVHNASGRRERPLVKVNCAALPEALIESEFFGHERGAFTGALARKIGRFELADRGTIFLDEIGDLPLELQAKLLRVLQEGEFERLGNSRTTKVDVRVIAATNRDLERTVASGHFREDLYYRLNVFPVVCPPLRERAEDIPILVHHFLAKSSAKIGKHIETVPARVMEALQGYRWPGNVRELENVIERAIILTNGPALELEEMLDSRAPAGEAPAPPATLKDLQRASIRTALEACRWVIEGEGGAAAQLALPPSSLRSKMRKLGLKKPTA